MDQYQLLLYDYSYFGNNYQGIGSKPKSSSQPTFVDSMADVIVSQVAMGQEHTILLVNNNDLTSNEKYLAQPEYIPKDEKTSD